MSLPLVLHPGALGLWRRAPDAQVPAPVLAAEPMFVARTAGELSIVAPIALERVLGATSGRFRLLSIDAVFGTTETGIFKGLADPLAAAEVWILPLGTHDTDHVLVREDQLATACAALRAAGHRLG